jgi:capsular exopolysaccharide synthesis family protein
MLKVHIRRTLLAAIIAGLFGFFIAYNSKKLYEATVDVMAGSPQLQSDASMPIEVRKVLGAGFQNDLDSDTGIIRSQRIFNEGLKRAAAELNKPELTSPQAFAELYPMSDLDIPASLNQYAPDQMRVVKIKVRAHSPEEAASIANNVASAFADYRKERSKNAVKGALDMVSTAAKKAKLKLDTIDAQFKKLKIDNNIIDVQANATAGTEELNRLRERKSLLESQLEGAKAELASLRVALSGTPKTSNGITSIERDAKIGVYIQVEAAAKTEYNTMRQQYADDSPLVIHAKEKLDAATKERADAEKEAKQVTMGRSTVPNPSYLEFQSKVATAKAQVNSIRDSLAPVNFDMAAAQAKAAKYPAVESKIFDLQRNRLVYEDQFEKNQKFTEELQNSSEGTTSQIQNVADANQISDPVAPDIKKYVVLAGIVGALIGLAYSFAMESFKLPVHTSWQLAELTALPVAASIPMMPKPLARRHYSEIRNANFKPIESFRYMAFSMMAKENRPGVILFTAVGEDVDSTGAAAEFAVAMSKTGSKVALVDCDLRLPRLSELFGVQGRSGVAEILGRTILPGESTDLFVSTEHDNLLILPAGAASPSGLSDFNSSHMAGLIDDLREKADTVVINCPPVDVFADASRLATYVDEVCMVISAKTTSYRAIPVAQEILHKSGAKEMSIVLTNGSPTEEPFGSRTGTSVARR